MCRFLFMQSEVTLPDRQGRRRLCVLFQEVPPEHSGRSLADVRRRMHELSSSVGMFQHVWLRSAPVSARRSFLGAVLSQPPIQVPP